MNKLKKKSLFDDIFKLQSTAPELDDVDPEDLEQGLTASLVEQVDETEAVEPSSLRKKTALIADDPKYKGKKTSRKDLYSDDEAEETLQDNSYLQKNDTSDDSVDMSGDDSNDSGPSDSDNGSNDDEGEEEDDDDMIDEEEEEEEEEKGIDESKQDSTILRINKSDDREKGRAVHLQMDIWDQMIKSRISLQKIVSLCNRLPPPDLWAEFAENSDFHQEAGNAHSSVRKLLMHLLEIQKSISSRDSSQKNNKDAVGDSDEEITSESEAEGEEKDSGGTSIGPEMLDKDDAMEGSDDMSKEEGDEDMEKEVLENISEDLLTKKSKQKRKLDLKEMEVELLKCHTDFQAFRNDTLSKWDEKTRLTHGKIRSKNFAAFEMSVLKQIEQVLVNRERLIRRIHQQRTAFRVLGCPETTENGNAANDVDIDDDEDVDVEIKQRCAQEIHLNKEIIDDSDFYHVCLRDLIEMKQNEETDPVTTNKQWLEIQRLRNKQKRKVDTRASKGRKIRYNVREKLKNYMTPYDKSAWSDEQKDDLFKALFGGKSKNKADENGDVPTIDIGL